MIKPLPLNDSKFIKSGLMQLLLVVCIFLVLPHVAVASDCIVNIKSTNGIELTESISMQRELAIKLPAGKNSLTFECKPSKEGVFSFSHMAIVNADFLIDGIEAQRLVSNQISYLTPPKTFSASMELTNEITHKLRLKWFSIPEYLSSR